MATKDGDGGNSMILNPEAEVKPPQNNSPCALILAAERLRLEPDEFRVYVALVVRADAEGAVAIRVKDLAEATLLSERRVRYVLKFLDAAGLIRRVGWSRNRRYFLRPVEEWKPSEKLPSWRKLIYTNRRNRPASKRKATSRPKKSKESLTKTHSSSRKPQSEASTKATVFTWDPYAEPSEPSEPMEQLRECVPLTRDILEAIRSPDGVSEIRRAFVLALAKRGMWERFYRLLRRRARDSAAWASWLETLAKEYDEKGERYIQALVDAFDRLEKHPGVHDPFSWLYKVALNKYEGKRISYRSSYEPEVDEELIASVVVNYDSLRANGPGESKPGGRRSFWDMADEEVSTGR